MKAKIHFAATDNPSPSICGRFSENYTRIVGCVTCLDCKNAIRSKFASSAQFLSHVPDAKLIAGYFNFSPIHTLSDNEMLSPFFSSFACQTCGNTLAGDRHYCSATVGKAHAMPREKLEVCIDCFQFFFA